MGLFWEITGWWLWGSPATGLVRPGSLNSCRGYARRRATWMAAREEAHFRFLGLHIYGAAPLGPADGFCDVDPTRRSGLGCERRRGSLMASAASLCRCSLIGARHPLRGRARRQAILGAASGRSLVVTFGWVCPARRSSVLRRGYVMSDRYD